MDFICHTIPMPRDGYEWAGTVAANMMAAGIQRANEEMGLSLRQLGKQLGYKQAVVLSHMSNGKAPIPIDRAEELAEALQLDPIRFLRAVLYQRHPQVKWDMLFDTSDADVEDPLAVQLEAILGATLSELNSEQRKVMREVASDARPNRRWLTVHEIPSVEEMRQGKTSSNDRREGENTEVDEVLKELREKGGQF